MNLSVVLGGGYLAFLSLFLGAIFGEHYRRHGEPPVAAVRRAYRRHVRNDLREDVEALQDYGAVEWAHSVVTTVLMPAILARTTIHLVAYHTANPGGRPEAHFPRLFRSPVTPRPVWNDLSARVVAFLLIVQYGWSMWAAWAASLNSAVLTVYVTANAALLLADLPAGIVLELHEYVTENA